MQINHVLQGPVSKQRLRILSTDLTVYQVIDIDDASAWPFPLTLNELEDFEEIDDPFPLPYVQAGSTAEQKRDEAMSAIEYLLENHAQLFEKKTRNQLLKKAIEKTGRPRLFMVRALRRFWQRGMSPNALVPDYKNCGGGGKPRRKLSQKLGRKRSVSPG
ncbi:hypothetical protein ABMA58_02525, partial [Oceanospirillum sp. HFRX-1_2]